MRNNCYNCYEITEKSSSLVNQWKIPPSQGTLQYLIDISCLTYPAHTYKTERMKWNEEMWNITWQIRRMKKLVKCLLLEINLQDGMPRGLGFLLSWKWGSPDSAVKLISDMAGQVSSRNYWSFSGSLISSTWKQRWRNENCARVVHA